MSGQGAKGNNPIQSARETAAEEEKYVHSSALPQDASAIAKEAIRKFNTDRVSIIDYALTQLTRPTILQTRIGTEVEDICTVSTQEL